MATVFLALMTIALSAMFSISEMGAALSLGFSCKSLRLKTLLPLCVVIVVLGLAVGHLTGVYRPAAQHAGASELQTALILLCALAAAGFGRIFAPYSPVVLSVAAAAAAFPIFSGGSSDVAEASAGSAVLTMVASAIVAAVLAVVLQAVIRRFSSDAHYFTKLRRYAALITAATLQAMFAAGLNLTLLSPLGPDGSTWMSAYPAAGGQGAAEGISRGLALACVAAGLLAGIVPARQRIFRTGEALSDIGPATQLAVLLSAAVTTAFFSFRGTASLLALRPLPLSTGLLCWSGLAACLTVSYRGINRDGKVLRTLASCILTPAMAFLLSGALFYLSGDGTRSPRAVLVLGCVAAAMMVLIAAYFFIWLYEDSRRSAGLLRAQEEALDDNRRSLNNLEVKNILSDNQHLRDQLEMKRKEVVSIAVGITEQKEFTEKLYSMVQAARAEEDPDAKDRALREIATELQLRMNFDGEIDSFYTQVESLHRDFSNRLMKKHPDLTKQERRLSTLLRLGFSTKYIAGLMNIAPKSVDICRHRLRMKFRLDRGQNLSDYIKNI